MRNNDASNVVELLKTSSRFVFPMRDAAVKVYPCLRLILPEYAMVPPTPVHLRHSEESSKQYVLQFLKYLYASKANDLASLSFAFSKSSENQNRNKRALK